MRLYHHPASSNARRVRIAAQLLGTPLELVEVDLMDEAARRRLGEINLNSKVPVLDDHGFLLWESGAIMQYLADMAPDQTLYPQDARARADVNRWMFWACQHFAPAVGVLTWEHVWKGMTGNGAADPVEVARGEREVGECGAVLERHLSSRQYVAGHCLTLADVAVATPLMYRAMARLPLADLPHLAAWFARIEALPAWQASAWESVMPAAA